MDKLSDPRDVKECYVNFSAESLKDEESDHEELTSPLASPCHCFCEQV